MNMNIVGIGAVIGFTMFVIAIIMKLAPLLT